MKFTKMQGIGNDYVYVNGFTEHIADPSSLAIRLSDRHFGIGSDGLIIIQPSSSADCRMEMYNQDGSRGSMCGNGIRCVAKYAYDHNLAGKKTEMTIETDAGLKTVSLDVREGCVRSVLVDMGEPILAPSRIPVKAGGSSAVNIPIQAAGMDVRFTGVSMGNPHAVIFLPDVDALDLAAIGPAFEHHPFFPDRVNTEFIRILDDHTLKMRVWERGSGETLACGTGACASAVAAILCGYASKNEDITVKLLGGDLTIRWDEKTGHIFMAGPAVTVFEGEVDA